MPFSGLKLIKKKYICIQLESQWQLYFVFEKTKVALEVFVSVMDCIHYKIGDQGLANFKSY